MISEAAEEAGKTKVADTSQECRDAMQRGEAVDGCGAERRVGEDWGGAVGADEGRCGGVDLEAR